MAVNKDFLLGFGAGKAQGGGGNQNVETTINGTMEDPFGDYSISDLATGLLNGNMSASISFDGTPIGIPGTIFFPLLAAYSSKYIIYGVQGSVASAKHDHGSAGITMSAVVYWHKDTGFEFAVMNVGGVDTDLSAYAPMIQTVLKLIYHPLPH